MQRLMRHVSVIRMTNRRRSIITIITIVIYKIMLVMYILSATRCIQTGYTVAQFFKFRAQD